MSKSVSKKVNKYMKVSKKVSMWSILHYLSTKSPIESVRNEARLVDRRSFEFLGFIRFTNKDVKLVNK